MYVGPRPAVRVVAARGAWLPGVPGRLVRPGGEVLTAFVGGGRRRGLGDCTVLPYDAALSAMYGGAAMCRDSATGAVVPCNVAPCGQAAPAASSPGSAPVAYVAPPTQVILTQVPGFLGDLSVPTLESLLERQLAESEGLPMQNQLRAGSITLQQMIDDFFTLKDQYCGNYPAACPPGASSLAQSYADRLRAWSASLPPASPPPPVVIQAQRAPSSSPAPSPAGDSGNYQTTQLPPQPAGSAASPPAGGGGGGAVAPASGSPVSDFLTSTFSIFGFSVPVWGALLAGSVGAYALSGRSR
jgi:hypothetical protein